MTKLWEVSFVGERDHLLSVSAQNGWMVAGGYGKLYRLRPGAEGLQMRGHPLDDDDICCVAIEPRKPFRACVLTHRQLVIFDPTDESGFRHLTIAEGDTEATEVAWGYVDGKLVPYVLDSDGQVLRAAASVDALALEHVIRITNGRDGTLALVTHDDEDEFRLYTSRDGKTLHYRVVDYIDAWKMGLAVDGDTTAYADDEAVLLSRGKDEDFEQVEDIQKPGPLAFDDSGGLLVVDHRASGVETLLRVDVTGKSTRIAELQGKSETGKDPLHVMDIAWDTSRKVLWAATNEGLAMVRAPKGEVVLS